MVMVHVGAGDAGQPEQVVEKFHCNNSRRKANEKPTVRPWQATRSRCASRASARGRAR